MFFEVKQVNIRSQFSRDPEGPVTLNSSRVLSVKSAQAPANEKGAQAVIEYLVEYNYRRFIYTADSKAVIDELLRTRTASAIETQGQSYADQ
jgi:hypothetical protein